MSTRSDSSPGRGRTQRRGTSYTAPVTRYDAVLLLIPVIFLLAVGAVAVFGVPVPTAMAAGSALSVVAVTDALFLNPPTGRGPTN
ncbi:hypothetical protein [Haloarcula onubensis]|uniref:Uncharacterized protein n=1 Tax=Haloarcula onubensis TaxID=2950539 RepID=A0ABU2FRZ6_9EURY|nr:hypothetical protein [Halomicroarcula sp. S3CR25-11]MDS0283538.1 hypothetical protein [Halomicroarcula sp. S3CR25-11]